MGLAAFASLVLTATFMLELGSDFSELKAGYFVWVFSFGLLGISIVRGAVFTRTPPAPAAPNTDAN
jgi:hypothetical protein